MNEDESFKLPGITDEDIRHASRLLGLPAGAFHGEDGDDPRIDVFKCMSSIDVTACPGSGKTTLLVAKLAILANKWEPRTRGICVLSHTNAARREIEKRLGCAAVGRQLLSYPHYVGTIHGFVNAFLALPWLRALGYPVTMIDNEVCVSRRWRALPRNTRSGLEKNRHGPSLLCIAAPDFTFGTVPWGRGVLGTDTDTYSALQTACRKSIEEGYHCHDEMFVWATDMLDKVPGIIDVIRDRFPLVFIDEAQDNSETQSRLLHRIFIDGDDGVLRQRFGDSNQAVYNFVGARGAVTDAYPCGDIKSVPNSHRFGETIASLAEPLGLVAHDGGLKGHGPRPICHGSCITEGPHTVFLFQDDTINTVLPAYADLLIETFSDEELNQGTFAAVGQIHNDTGDDHRPRHAGHYWPNYDAELSKLNPQPKTFVQYIRAGQVLAEVRGETKSAVEKIAQGILRLAGMTEDGQILHRRKRSHRYVLDLLDDHPDARGSYTLLLGRFGVKRRVLNKSSWDTRWSKIVRRIAESAAAGCLSNADADAFLRWKETSDVTTVDMDDKVPSDNIYRYPADDPKVHISVGSVHSVKGQTHTATLVLETFWHKHNLEDLQYWLLGSKSGGEGIGDRQLSRLKLHYVAMTRPTHLLCLAMKRSTFENDDGRLDESVVQALYDQGWHVKQL